MIDGFSKKKIKAKPTLGEKLKRVRIGKKLTLLEVEAGTKVRQKYLRAIESDCWSELPQEVYIRSFVMSYARFLGLEWQVLCPLFESQVNVRKKNVSQFYYEKKVKDIKFLITPKVLGYASLAVFVVSLFSYIFYQVASFAGSPDLKVITPSDNMTVLDDQVEIEGVTEGNVILTINQEKVPVTSEGHFSTSLKLHRGVNVIEVKAVNRINKESSKLLTVECKPKTAQAPRIMDQE